ncbi:MAG: hypothetical protein JWM80_3521 [Cyanobacteria bacterium RYN_339]|nr:hypothetical protein [Cyanobacteria bacterium RYN_339]
MQPGDLDWIVNCLEQNDGHMPLEALERELSAADPAGLAALRERVAAAPQITRLGNGELALLRERVTAANFRLTPQPWEHAQGVLRLDGTEVAVALATQGPPGEVSWRGLDEPPAGPHRASLAPGGPDAKALVLPGVDAWYAAVGFAHGDDVLVHVRDVTTPLLVLDHVPRLDRDEGVLRRRSARVLDAACDVLEELGGWVPFERLLARVLGLIDYRQGTPPEAFTARLVGVEPRLLVSADGRQVRLAHFHTDAAARRYLSQVPNLADALPAFLEEFPPREPADREKAQASLEALWRETPRPELDGLTPAEADALAAKIVPFPRPG